jgi:hypothetical protein
MNIVRFLSFAVVCLLSQPELSGEEVLGRLLYADREVLGVIGKVMEEFERFPVEHDRFLDVSRG